MLKTFVLTIIALLLIGCEWPTAPTPKCIVETGYIQYYVNQPPVPVVMCQCDPGAQIPQECR